MAKGREAKDILVFLVRRDTECGECGAELRHGCMITLEEGRGALCLACADLDHLEFLPRGDAALTRRARKYSRLQAVVLQWSRARKRYERQGILAESEAITKAETECLADEELRAARRERERGRREALDREYVAAFAEKIGETYPGCPSRIAKGIAEHACLKYSGRVGRSAAAKALDPEAVTLAVTAWVRHRKTNYDDLLAALHDRHEARAEVRPMVEDVLAK